MNRSRVVLIIVVVCSLLAAVALGAAGVFGALVLRPLGFVAIAAAMVNIGIISSPQSRTGQRIAAIVGIITIVAACITSLWAFGRDDVDWWLPGLLLAGAALMIPAAALSLWSSVSGSEPAPAHDEDDEPAETPVTLSYGSTATADDGGDDDTHTSDKPIAPARAAEPLVDNSDITEFTDDDTSPNLLVDTRRFGSASPVRHDVAPQRGRRALDPLPDDEDRDEVDDEPVVKPRRSI